MQSEPKQPFSVNAILAAMQAGMHVAVVWNLETLLDFVQRAAAWAKKNGVRLEWRGDPDLVRDLVRAVVGGSIGVVAGFALAGPAGAAIGFVVGAAAGALLAHCQVEIRGTDGCGFAVAVGGRGIS